jgi:enoyl-CoA hydratase/carnithine racemase
LDAAVADLTAALIESPPEAVRAITALMNQAQTNSPADQLAAERSAQIGLIGAMAKTVAKSAAKA